MNRSGIVSVFSCGICMAHYAWYNLTWIAQVSCHHVIKAISQACENFVYCYLGMAAALSFKSDYAGFRWNGATIFIALFLVIISRAFNIFPFSACVNIRRKKKIPLNMQLMMWFAG